MIFVSDGTENALCAAVILRLRFTEAKRYFSFTK